MMSETMDRKPERSVWTKYVFPMAGGGLAGFLIAFFGIQFFDDGAFGALGSSAIAALAIGVVYAFVAIMVGVGAASPGLGSHFLNVEDADEIREMKQNLIYSGIAMLAFGSILGLLALASPGSILEPETVFIAGPALLLIGLLAGFRSHRASDELMQEVGRETGNVSYYLSLLAIGGWAALAHLGIVPQPAMLDVLSLFYSIVLIAAFWVCGRRGMLNRR